MPHTIRILTRAVIGNVIVNAGESVKGDEQFLSGLCAAGIPFTLVNEHSSGEEEASSSMNEAIANEAAANEAAANEAAANEATANEATANEATANEDGEPLAPPKNDRRHGAKPPVVHG